MAPSFVDACVVCENPAHACLCERLCHDIDVATFFARPAALLLLGDRSVFFLMAHTVALKQAFAREERIASGDYHEALADLSNKYAAARAAHDADANSTTVMYFARAVDARLYGTSVYKDLLQNGRCFGISIVQQARCMDDVGVAMHRYFDAIVVTGDDTVPAVVGHCAADASQSDDDDEDDDAERDECDGVAAASGETVEVRGCRRRHHRRLHHHRHCDRQHNHRSDRHENDQNPVELCCFECIWNILVVAAHWVAGN